MLSVYQLLPTLHSPKRKCCRSHVTRHWTRPSLGATYPSDSTKTHTSHDILFDRQWTSIFSVIREKQCVRVHRGKTRPSGVHVLRLRSLNRTNRFILNSYRFSFRRCFRFRAKRQGLPGLQGRFFNDDFLLPGSIFSGRKPCSKVSSDNPDRYISDRMQMLL